MEYMNRVDMDPPSRVLNDGLGTSVILMTGSGADHSTSELVVIILTKWNVFLQLWPEIADLRTKTVI